MTRLTANIRLDEFIVSTLFPELAAKINLTPQDVVKMSYLARIFLQPVRDRFNKALVITSGKRSLELNSKLGGSIASDHLYGDATPKAAVDFYLPGVDMWNVYCWLKNNRKGSYGQLIYYKVSNFIHISMPTEFSLGEDWEWQK